MGKQIAIFALPEDFIDLVSYLKSRFPDLIRLDPDGRTKPLTSDYSYLSSYLVHQSTLETFRRDYPKHKQWEDITVSLETISGLFFKNGHYNISDMGAGRLYIRSDVEWGVPMYQETVELYYESCRYVKKRAIRYYCENRSGKSRSYIYALQRAHEAVQASLREIPNQTPRWFTYFTCEGK